MIQLDFLAVLEQWPALLRGAGFTLALSAVSAVVGVSLGIACGGVRANGPRWASAMAAGYIELIRNTPFIVQLFFVFFGLPSLGVKLSPEMLFDEITSALDPELVGEVLRVVETLAEEGMTLLMVTHEMTFARKVADRVVFMHAGKILRWARQPRFFVTPKLRS